MTKVITRIAPSPTGMMHIGTARTALFNYLYAKHMGGEFRLRIEDTDKDRSTDEATQVILDGLKWFGLDYDGGVVFQSANAKRHVAVIQSMVLRGAAYLCFLTPDEADAIKVKNKAFRSPYRDVSDSDLSDDRPFVVRLKVPLGEEIIVDDLVKGPIKFNTDNLDDIVLMRSDGTPTYNLAVVVDDHDMGVTHVIRGDDHVNNTPRQMLIYRGMGWDIPAFAHIPLIFNEQGKKLSKRDGAASIMDYARAGYLPEAMRNYLGRLGWGHGDDEIFSDADAIDWFDIKDVLSSPARMNAKKLNHINKHYLKESDAPHLVPFVYRYFDQIDGVFYKNVDLISIVHCLKGNATTINDIGDAMIAWVFNRPTEIDEKASAALADPAVLDAVRLAYSAISVLPNELWIVDHLNDVLHILAADNGIHMKVLGSGMRAVLTGRASAPDLGSCLVAIGQEESLLRLSTAIG